MNIEKINFCAVKRTNNNSSKKNIANNAMPQNRYNNFSKEACAAFKSINFGSGLGIKEKYEAPNLVGRTDMGANAILNELYNSCILLNKGKESKLKLADYGIINIATRILNGPSQNFKNEVMKILNDAQQETTEGRDSLLEQYDNGYNPLRSLSEKIVRGRKIITMTEFSNKPRIPTRVSEFIRNKSLTVKAYSYPDNICSTYVYDLTKDENKELKSYSEAPIGKKDECNFKLSFKDGWLQSAIFGMKRNKEGITTIDKIFNFKDNSTDPSSVIVGAKVCKDGSLTAKSYYQFNESGYICYDEAHISQNPNSNTNVNEYNAVIVNKDGHKFKADKINFTDAGCELVGNVHVFKGKGLIDLVDRVII